MRKNPKHEEHEEPRRTRRGFSDLRSLFAIHGLLNKKIIELRCRGTLYSNLALRVFVPSWFNRNHSLRYLPMSGVSISLASGLFTVSPVTRLQPESMKRSTFLPLIKSTAARTPFSPMPIGFCTTRAPIFLSL